MSMVVSVSLQPVRDALQQQRPHAPQPWEEHAQRWLRVEDLAPTHAVGQADMGKLVVLEGAEYWACVWVEKGGLDWIMVTASRLVRQSRLSLPFLPPPPPVQHRRQPHGSTGVPPALCGRWLC